jgi:hypothetical protein
MNDRTIDQMSYTMAGGLSRRQLLRLLGGGATAGALAVAGLSSVRPTSAQAGLNLPITVAGVFDGVFAITQFAIQQGQVVALGTLTGTNLLTGLPIDPAPLTLPVLNDLSFGDCQILNLVLGPLDLTLLGLNVFLDTVTLVITAEQGGELLGDLLCAISGLLSGPGGALGRLRNLLNQIFGALGGA